MGTHAAALTLTPNLAYDPENDFEPVGIVAEYPLVLALRKDFAADTLPAFVAYAKANEAKLNMAHAGIGSVSHVGCLLLDAAIGIKPTMVPFTGTGPAMNALLAGQVDYVCDPIARTDAACAGRHDQGAGGRERGSAIRLCPTCRLPPRAACRSSTARRSTACSRPRARRGTVVDRLAEALSKGLNEDLARKRLTDLGAEVPEREPARRRSRSRRW